MDNRLTLPQMTLPVHLPAWAGLLIILGITLLLGLWTLEDVGICVDEPDYFRAAWLIANWYDDLLTGKISLTSDLAAWEFNWEHPPLAKIVCGLTDRLFGPGRALIRPGRQEHGEPLIIPTKLGLLGPLGGMRLGALLFLLLSQVALYLLVQEDVGRAAGLFAAASLVGMPHIFGHSHLVCLDMPFATAALWLIYAFRRGLTSKRASLLTGVCFGLCLAAKINALILPLPLLLWGLYSHPRKIWWNFLAMAVVGPLLLYLLWPRLWLHPIDHFWQYFEFHLHHEYHPTYYFGQVYSNPPVPWHYPFVTLMIATPPISLGLGFLGMLMALLSWRSKPVGWLLILNFLAPMLLLSCTKSPKYDSLRLYLLTPVILAALAGWGFAAFRDWVGRYRAIWRDPSRRTSQSFSGLSRGVTLFWGILLLAPSAFALIMVHPYPLAYFNSLIGGVRGAAPPPAGIGMESNFWGEAVALDVVAWINQNLPRGATIDTNEASFGILREYQRIGRLRPDLQFQENAEYWVLISQQGYWISPYFWELYYEKRPEWAYLQTFSLDSVPLVKILQRLTPP
jgi:4-amino-4-deoxy-L-arabinose transferase-like glycosyltransferase